ncbi:MAG TPA: Lrp/AsnC family transcriptional regulator [Pseudonocardia sp.]|jgi:DNA-binding Lrp family transcriptional regulator
MAGVDDIDMRLLDLLQQDGRATFAHLAVTVGLSLPAVKRRVDRLQECGVITGFAAKIDRTKLGWGIEAFIELRYVGRTRPPEIEKLAHDMAEVDAVFSIAGDPDALCHVRARDIAHLRVVIDAIRQSSGVMGTKTLMVLGSSQASAE